MKYRVRRSLLISLGMLVLIFMLGASVPSVKVFNIEEQTYNEDYANKKIIYLTFDDGPSSKVTDGVLDVLKEKDVKATFFLIGNQIKDREDVVKRIHNEGHGIGLHTYNHKFKYVYRNEDTFIKEMVECGNQIKDREDVVKRIHNEGHGIGLHTYNHKFKYVYRNEDTFIKEMVECRNEINRVVGASPNIIRFPGGSYKHLSKQFLSKLHDDNFKVYDWNLDNTDGMNQKLDPNVLYKKAIKGSENLHPIILLMHCTDMNKNTYKALPDIIDYYKNEGYQFRIIDENTPEMYFRIK